LQPQLLQPFVVLFGLLALQGHFSVASVSARTTGLGLFALHPHLSVASMFVSAVRTTGLGLLLPQHLSAASFLVSCVRALGLGLLLPQHFSARTGTATKHNARVNRLSILFMLFSFEKK
jgi:hypothetical protein